MLYRLFILFITLVYYSKIHATAPIILKSNEEKNLHFYYHDSLGYGHPVNVVKGITRMYINAPVLLFEADKNQTPYLVYPGETINIKKDSDLFSEFSIKDKLLRNNELLFFKVLVKQSGGIYMNMPTPIYQAKANNLNQVINYEREINNIKKYRLLFLDSFSNKLTVSDNFKEVAKNIILCTAIKDSILLYRNNMSLLKDVKLYDKKFYQLIKTINGIDYFSAMPYLYACLLPVSINVSDGNSTEYTINNNAEVRTAFDFIETNFKKLAKIFLLSRTIYSALDNNVSISDNCLQRFKIECTDTTYRNLIDDKLKEKTIINSAFKKNIIWFMNETKTNLNNLILRNKGKLIYLDFWASWCAPCRSEMPYSMKLKKLFQKKDIIFLYISIDRNISDWKKAFREESMSNNNSFLMINSTQSSFMKQYKITSIPRYILIGRKGNIISADAPLPSDNKIIEIINNNL